jgi:hypothetical protein
MIVMNRNVMACLAAVGSTVCLAAGANAAAGPLPALFAALPPVELLQPAPAADRHALVTAETQAVPDWADPVVLARGGPAEAAAPQSATPAERAPQIVLAAVPSTAASDRPQGARAKARSYARALQPPIVRAAALPGDRAVPARMLHRGAERAAARGVLIIGLGS